MFIAGIARTKSGFGAVVFLTESLMMLFSLFDNDIKLARFEVLSLKVPYHKSGLNSLCCVIL